MKNSMKFVGIIAGATLLSAAASASDTVNGKAMAPTQTTAEAVSSFVDRYAVGETLPGIRVRSSVATNPRVTNVTLYPTADRDVVFVSFSISGAERIALAETHNSRITRFTDFAGVLPRMISIRTVDSGDAQAQARSILSPVSSAALSSSTPEQQWKGVQQQAADLLQFSSVANATAERTLIASREVTGSVGDSPQIACTFADPHRDK